MHVGINTIACFRCRIPAVTVVSLVLVLVANVNGYYLMNLSPKWSDVGDRKNMR